MTRDDIDTKLDEIFSRGTADFVDPDGAVRKKIKEKALGNYDKDIVVKFGVDPNRPDIHLGHAVAFRKLRQLQDMGCKIVFLVGDFTATIGDPTGKSKIRPEIEQEEVEKNVATYIEQIGKILRTDEEVFSWIRNSDWYVAVSDIAVSKPVGMEVSNDQGIKTKINFPPNSFVSKAAVYENTRMQKTYLKREQVLDITFRGFLWTLRNITHSRLIDRDMFQERIQRGDELYMNEMMYPVLQGIDSYILAGIYGSCDMEVGGTDQMFNMLMGRDVMKMNNTSSQAVMSVEILAGTDGHEKMSKSLDNYIGITDAPHLMYGKIMSVPDACISQYFKLCTYTPAESVEEITAQMEKGELHPRDVKMRLAKEIVSIYHGEASAEKAEKDFVNTFQKGGIPSEIPEAKVSRGTPVVDVLLDRALVSSKTDFRRLVDEGAIKVTDNDTKMHEYDTSIQENMTLKVGKKNFLRIVVE